MRVRVNDIMVGYSDEGAHGAPTVILVHGFPFNRSMWKSQMEALSDGWRVVAIDIRGHGESDIGEKPFSIGLFAEDLIGLMDVLGIEKALLCGLSMGGYIALNAALSHPGRFDALVLSDTQWAAEFPRGEREAVRSDRSHQKKRCRMVRRHEPEKLFYARIAQKRGGGDRRRERDDRCHCRRDAGQNPARLTRA